MAPPVSLSPSPEKREYSILASVAGSTEIPVNLVPVQSDHSLHRGMLIAAHAIALNAVMVSHDGAFAHVEDLSALADWAADL